MAIYLFVLSPPYSGSTVLWQLLATSPNVSTFPEEGQFLEGVREFMRKEPWNPNRKLPWDTIKSKWDAAWDQSKPVLLEKSPPNISRAFEIEKVFDPAYFIAIIQNPYAQCAGVIRRKGDKFAEGMKGIAKFWVECAQYQRKNIQGLSRVIHFTYETFTENPSLTCERIIDFVPAIQQLDTDAAFSIKSVLGAGPKKIVNLSQLKINLLSQKDIVTINNILEEHPDLMKFFGYDYIYPSFDHNIRRYRALISVNVSNALRRARNLRRKVIDRVRVGGSNESDSN